MYVCMYIHIYIYTYIWKKTCSSMSLSACLAEVLGWCLSCAQLCRSPTKPAEESKALFWRVSVYIYIYIYILYIIHHKLYSID